MEDTRQPNGLWMARKKAGLAQKAVARMLQHKSTSQLSEYERGRLTPTLKNAFKLSVIYGTPLSALYPQMHELAKQDVERSRSLFVIPARQLNNFYAYRERAHFGS